MTLFLGKPIGYTVLVDNFYETPCDSYFEASLIFAKKVKTENLTSICYRALDERGNKCIYTLVRFNRQEGFKRFARLEDIVAVFQDHNSTVKVEEFEIGVDEDLSPIALDGFWVKVTTKAHGWLHVYFNKNNGQLEWY